jgi:hypothetical protein
MNVLFIILLVLNLLVEALAAATLIGGPGGLAAAGSGNQWSMHYGFAARANARAAVWTAVTPVLGLLMVFHSGLFVSLAVAGDQMGGMVIHAVLAAMAIGLFVSRTRWQAG